MNLPHTYPDILVKSTACFFVVIDPAGSVKYANEYFLKIFSPHTLQSKFTTIFERPENADISEIIHDTFKTEGKLSATDLVFCNHTGTKLFTRWNFTSSGDNKGNAELQGLGTIISGELAEANLPEPKVKATKADDRINKLLANISDGFFTVDRSLNVQYWNRKVEDIFGVSRDQIIGKNLREVLTEKLPEPFFKELERALQKTEPIRFQEYLIVDNVWLDISAYVADNMLSVFVVDTTERKRSDQEVRTINERLKVVEKATKDVIWDWDLQTNKVIWNDNITSMFGYTQEDVYTQKTWWLDHLHPDDRDRVKSNLRKHIRERLINWQNEYRFRCSNGAYKYVYDRGFALYDAKKEPLRMIGTMQDLTERKASEFILKKLNNSLEKRAKELATSNDELERFAYVTSHDLQEPLRMVSSFLQLLQKRYKDKLDAKAHEYIGFAVDGAERMKVLILDLLEYSRVNTNKGVMEEVNLNEVADHIMLTYKQLLTETDGVINFGTMPVVKGNRTQLTQLLQNLVGNALKYRSGKPPVINITCKESAQEFEFAVVDNGIGIEPRFYSKIFVIFQRLHHKNEYSGTGIGLAICKKIIEKHGGKIWVESDPGNGSTFYFTLPK